MASSSSGLTYSPAALDPYQLETELAKSAYEGPGNPQQQTQLDQYWLERQANKNLYGQEVEANRQLQQQQMANALREKYLQLYKDADPGLVDVINQQGGFYGADPTAMMRYAIEKAHAQNLSSLGTASSGLSTAGMGADALTANTGLQGFGVRPDIQIAQLKEAGANARAAMHGPKEDSFIAPVGGPDVIDPSTGQVQKTGVKLRYSDTDEMIQKKVEFARRALGLTQLQPSGIPGVTQQQGPLGGGTGGTVGGGTRLQLGPGKPAAKPATSQAAPPAAPSGQSFAQGTQILVDKGSQQRARAGLSSLPSDYKSSYAAQMPKRGNNVPVAMHNGQLHYVSPSGQVGPPVP